MYTIIQHVKHAVQEPTNGFAYTACGILFKPMADWELDTTIALATLAVHEPERKRCARCYPATAPALQPAS